MNCNFLVWVAGRAGASLLRSLDDLVKAQLHARLEDILVGRDWQSLPPEKDCRRKVLGCVVLRFKRPVQSDPEALLVPRGAEERFQFASQNLCATKIKFVT